uniref:F-box domain-containing protein n=1 Tax=Cannabis sativa TaxID=3483 RepID=A0A803QX41_CANSA
MDNKKPRTTSSMVDRISKLPDSVILHILSFLPIEDVVSTCLISKRWKLMWYKVPKLSFSNKTTRFRLRGGQKTFCNYVDNCLEHRKRVMHSIPNSVITRFELHMDCYKRSKAAHIDKWLAFVVENSVEEINLFLSRANDDDDGQLYYYCLPKTVVFNASCLTVLELSMVELDSRYSFSFPSLKSLSLTLVRFADKDVVDGLLLGSPSLEKLWLISCSLSNDHQLHISSLSLKFLKIRLANIVEQIEAVNLESLDLYCVSFSKNLSVSKAIRNLSLTCDWRMEKSSIEYLISSLPLLENLTLSNCQYLGLKQIKISSQSLKSFNLNNSYDVEMNVIIESAPKLASFCYVGNIKFSISMESPNLINGTFIIIERRENYNGDWFIDMINFLLNLNCSWNSVSLHVDSAKGLILPENLKRLSHSPLVNWEHLRVFTDYEPENKSDLRDALMWISPSLKTLSIAKKGIFLKTF